MSKTVSFVARDELAEWLESRAEKEMKSVSAVCQDIVAAEYRRKTGKQTGKGGESAGPLEQPPFTDHPRAWYEPNTQDPDHLVGVRIPDGDGYPNEDRRYYKTYDGAAKAIKRWYE